MLCDREIHQGGEVVNTIKTVRTVSIETHKRNLRSRIAWLLMHGINRGLSEEETKELLEKQEELRKLERS
jgi:hypothetical protein